MDYAAYLAERRYLGLLELIDMLPAASRLKEAISQDEEAAEYILSLPESAGPQEPWAPPASEFTLTNLMLSTLINETRSLKMAVQSSAGHKPQKEEPFPAPRTAIDRILERQENEWVASTLQALGFDENGF